MAGRVGDLMKPSKPHEEAGHHDNSSNRKQIYAEDDAGGQNHGEDAGSSGQFLMPFATVED